MKVKAYLEITMQIADENRSAAANVFFKYKEEFLKNIQGAITKDLLIRKEDFSDPRIKAFFEYIKSEEFKERIKAFGDYTVKNIGEVIEI